MIINDNEFPVIVQAFQTSGRNDLFVAEQVVNSQHETDKFTARYAGYLIKARTVNDNELQVDQETIEKRNTAPRRSGMAFWGILLLLLVAMIIAGFTSGWFQQTFLTGGTGQ